jgi:LacI family transcriptional regulator
MRQKKKVTLKDIAIKAGVSTALVSYVMNGKEKEGKVSKEMAIKINAIAKEMNFKPHFIARSLRSGKSKTLGLVIADISNPFFANIARVVENEAKRFGYTVFYGSSDEDASKSSSLIDVLIDRTVDGFIIVSAENSQPKVRELIEQNVPFVLLDRYFPEIQTNYVSTNNYQAAFDACTHLVEMGYKRVGLIAYDSALHHMKERIRGYQDALNVHGIQSESQWLKKVLLKDVQVKTREAINDMISCKKPVDSIIFSTYNLAVNGLKYINELGLRVPEDVGVVSFGQAELFDLYQCPISFIMQQMDELGKKAVELLIHKINHPDTPNKQVLMQATLIPRASSRRK